MGVESLDSDVVCFGLQALLKDAGTFLLSFVLN